jgi:hypothetical protein
MDDELRIDNIDPTWLKHRPQLAATALMCSECSHYRGGKCFAGVEAADAPANGICNRTTCHPKYGSAFMWAAGRVAFVPASDFYLKARDSFRWILLRENVPLPPGVG